jgi:hypothetical protein
MNLASRTLRILAVACAMCGLAFADAQTGTTAAQHAATKWGNAQVKGVKRHLKIRRRHHKRTRTASGSNNGAQTNGSGGGNAGSGNGASTQSGSSSNRNNSDNNQNNSNHSTQTAISGATLMAGLININVQNVNLNIYKVVDVHNVLNNSQVELLTQKIINSPGAQAQQSILNDLLRDAHVLNGNQIVVGVLSKLHRIFYTTKPG